jgi:hypothetical protein
MNHFGFMRPKSVRTCRRSARFESSTTGPSGPRQNTTQCQDARSPSLCHLTASSARSGRASHEVNGTLLLAALIPYSLSNLRTWCVSDHNFGSSEKIPIRFATRCASRYLTPASAATLAMPHPVRSSCTTAFIATLVSMFVHWIFNLLCIFAISQHLVKKMVAPVRVSPATSPVIGSNA